MYRIDTLLKQEQKLFHTQDLALLWSIKNPNTLYTAIKRYVKKGVLIRIHKGFYSVVPLEQINPVKLGIGYLHRYAYLSTESVLREKGIIFQEGGYITLISLVSKKFAVGKYNYIVRSMKKEFLYQTVGLLEKEGVKIATVERAAADILYYNPHYHFDNPQSVDWQKLKKIQKEVGYK